MSVSHWQKYVTNTRTVMMDLMKTIVITALPKYTRYNKKNNILEFLYTYLPVQERSLNWWAVALLVTWTVASVCFLANSVGLYFIWQLAVAYWYWVILEGKVATPILRWGYRTISAVLLLPLCSFIAGCSMNFTFTFALSCCFLLAWFARLM